MLRVLCKKSNEYRIPPPQRGDSLFNMRAPTIHRTAVAIYFFCCGCIFATWAARIPSIKESFHFNEAELGAVLFMLPFGSIVALPFAGWSISKLGSRFMTFTSAIIYPIILILIGYSNTPFLLSLLLFSFGFFGDILNIAMNTQAIFVQEEMYGRPMLSFFHAMWSVGALTGAASGGFFMKAGISTLNHFWIIAAFTITLAIIFLSFLVPRERFKTESQKLFRLARQDAMVAWCHLFLLCAMRRSNGRLEFALLQTSDQ